MKKESVLTGVTIIIFTLCCVTLWVTFGFIISGPSATKIGSIITLPPLIISFYIILWFLLRGVVRKFFSSSCSV
jgi:hypothetical protein